MKMNKASITFIACAALILSVALAEVDTAETMQTKIRNRGTIILSAQSQTVLDTAKPGEGAGASAPAGGAGASAPAGGAGAPAPTGAAKPAHRLKSKKDAPANNDAAASTGDSKKSIFQGDKTEVPVLCNKLSKTQLLGLATNGPSYQKSWIAASGTNTGTYNNLPFLDDKKLAAFYKTITTGVKLESGQLKPEEAEAKSKELLSTVLFDEDKRTDIGWLEFWVYMCNDGTKPEDNEYMSETDNIRKHVEGVLTGKIKPPEKNSTAAATPAKEGSAAPAAPAAKAMRLNMKSQSKE